MSEEKYGVMYVLNTVFEPSIDSTGVNSRMEFNAQAPLNLQPVNSLPWTKFRCIISKDLDLFVKARVLSGKFA